MKASGKVTLKENNEMKKQKSIYEKWAEDEINVVYAEPMEYFPKEIRKEYKLGEYAESEVQKKIKAVMLGHAVGDALGVPVEFCSREELAENPVTDMRGWGSYPVPEGCWSDDTSMSLAALDSLAKGKVNYNEVMLNFVRWTTLNEYTPSGEMFDIGRTCLSAIRNYLHSDGADALKSGLDDEHSNGNGSLMRIHPFALFLYYKGLNENKYIEVIHNASALTHAHERSKMACGIYTFILWELLNNPCRGSIIRGLNQASEYYGHYKEYPIYDRMLMKRIGRIYRCREDIDDYKGVTCDEIKSSGYVVDTLEAAIWCVLTTQDYKSCVLKAVNLGGDTDTVAAVAGGLAGALYGLESIPEEWLGKLKRKEYIEMMCEQAGNSWKQ